MFYLSIFLILIVIELLYFKVADIFNIIDSPNHRSSHSYVNIRGGGIIFCLSLLISAPFTSTNYPYFLVGLFIIGLISFIDDIKTISSSIRLVFHLAAVALLFNQLGLYNLPIYLILIGFVFVIGTINAINFMDGINGITGGYGLIALVTLLYINNKVVLFADNYFIVVAIISVLVFNFFNFRPKARCFAGDVGSVSLAFILVFFILLLVIKTQNLSYILLLLVYGLDTATTIILRLIRKERISEAHRTHYYQFLANEKKMPHIAVALIYMAAQLFINGIIIFFSPYGASSIIAIIVISTVLFLALRWYTEGSERLLRAKVDISDF